MTRPILLCILLWWLLPGVHKASSTEIEQPDQRFTISGFVYEQGSRETLIGATIYIPALRTGTTTNNYGFYSITLPAGHTEIIFSYVGYRSELRTFTLSENLQLDMLLVRSIDLDAIEITEERVEQISSSVQTSRIVLPVGHIRSVPALLGEKDVFKTIQLLPGVQSGQEGTSGFYVRGGGPDQNLIILDDAIVYNASHLFGFFSIFNGDAIKNVQLYKGGFPARFGGRLSSVLDISMKDGNKEKFQGEAGIGILSARLTLEGPIVKEKASFLVSGRRTYIDALLLPFMPKDERGGYFFYDVNTKLHYDHNRKHTFYASTYAGRDKFYVRFRDGINYREESGLYWQNTTSTLRWNHLIHDKLFANTSLIYSDYTLRIYAEELYAGETYSLSYSSGIKDIGVKYDLSWHPNPNHMVRAGFQSTIHRFTPSAFVLKDEYAGSFTREVQSIRVIESGLYIEDEIRLGDRAKINPGVRLSHFTHEGKHYFRPEPRFSLVYMILPDLSWKSSYAAMNQYVHLLSPTGIGLPTDLWVPSTKNIMPQSSWQLAGGIAKDFISEGVAVSLEGYYKKSDNTIGYREGASFLLIDDPSEGGAFSWENNITSGQAWSYGMELFIQKQHGKMTGWIGYTLSRTQMQFDEVNQGNKFPARYDRRHDISLVGIYQLRPDITISGTWVYASGNALTLPIGEYAWITHNPWGQSNFYHEGHFDQENTPFKMLPWQYINDYGGKNAFRAGSYHRFDLSVQFRSNRILFNKALERTIEISVYNLYNRKNPFFYFIERNYMEAPQLKQVTLFPIIPSISINYTF
ncbi:MAG: TonB-dependent receptor [Bacteroidia bacterium]|nr:MAG: TonB-dependent receptor [Bacteroidia bacterium]